ncbi:hypothetical protein ABID42_000915 [Arcicella rosea]|uniref:hypothetical protein n=1 Tax=Arcicella rosea TaxID=502909 RepID=UPI00345D9AB1
MLGLSAIGLRLSALGLWLWVFCCLLLHWSSDISYRFKVANSDELSTTKILNLKADD